MLKGAQKRMIVVKTADSRVFEEAYFVMRGDMTASGRDMVSEANRIIESCDPKRREKRRWAPAAIFLPIVSFIIGGMFGVIVTLAAVIISG